jgi:hypothetical protein
VVFRAGNGGELMFKTFFCHNGSPFVRFQTKGLRKWNVQRNTKSDEKPDSIPEIENRLRSGGIGKSG